MEQSGQGTPLNLVVYESIHVSITRQRDGWGEQYQKKAAAVCLSPADMKTLQIKDGDCVEITSDSGSVVVVAEAENKCKEGMGQMPFSLYSNHLASYDPSVSPLPSLRLITSRASATTKGTTPVSDLLVRRTFAQERPAAASDI